VFWIICDYIFYSFAKYLTRIMVTLIIIQYCHDRLQLIRKEKLVSAKIIRTKQNSVLIIYITSHRHQVHDVSSIIIIIIVQPFGKNVVSYENYFKTYRFLSVSIRRRPSKPTSRHGRVASGPLAVAQLLGNRVCAAQPSVDRRDTVPRSKEVCHRHHPAHHVQRVPANFIRWVIRLIRGRHSGGVPFFCTCRDRTTILYIILLSNIKLQCTIIIMHLRPIVFYII